MEHYNVFGDNDEQKQESRRKVGKQMTNIVYPNKIDCTCGKWREFKYPCRHACGYYRIKVKLSFFKMCDQQVHYYHQYEAMKVLYKDNIWPVVTENLVPDGKTKPPEVKTSKGRPRTKQFWRHNRFVNHEDSTI